MNKKLIVTTVQHNRARLASAGKIGEDVRLGRITLEQGIIAAGNAGCVHLVASLKAKLTQKHDDFKLMVRADVRNGSCTVQEAFVKAKAFGITNLDDFGAELARANNRFGLTDVEMARRAAAVRAAQASTTSVAA